MTYELICQGNSYAFDTDSEETAVMTAWMLVPKYQLRTQDGGTISAFEDDPAARYASKYGRHPWTAFLALRASIAAAMENMLARNGCRGNGERPAERDGGITKRGGKSANVCAFEKAMEKTIKNTDIYLLRDVYFIMQDIRALEERREWQKDRMNGLSRGLSFTGGRSGEIRGLDSAYAALADLEEEMRDKVLQYRRALKQAENIINGIESLRMRTLVMMLYVDRIPARETRERLNMSRRHFDTAVEAIEQAQDMAHVRWAESCFDGEK